MQSFLSPIVTILVAGITLVVAHKFTSDRDRKNVERTVRIKALSEAYTMLLKAGIREAALYRRVDGSIDDSLVRGFEEAIGIIHLYGTVEHSVLANEVSRIVAKENMLKLTTLINSLRCFIRAELKIEALHEQPVYSRIDHTDTK